MNVLASPISPDTLLSSAGLAGLAVVLFAECGLLIGFFLPGDTLLLAAGVLDATGTLHIPFWQFLVVAPLAAILGNVVGYLIGRRAGPAVFTRPNSRLFRPEYVERAHRFFERFGWATILLARFVPIVRTVATVMAGVGRMRFGVYLLWTVVGGVIWTDGVLLIGHALGKVKFVQQHEGWVDYLVIAAVLIGLIPAAIHYLQGRRRSRAATKQAPDAVRD